MAWDVNGMRRHGIAIKSIWWINVEYDNHFEKKSMCRKRLKNLLLIELKEVRIILWTQFNTSKYFCRKVLSHLTHRKNVQKKKQINYDKYELSISWSLSIGLILFDFDLWMPMIWYTITKYDTNFLEFWTEINNSINHV